MAEPRDTTVERIVASVDLVDDLASRAESLAAQVASPAPAPPVDQVVRQRLLAAQAVAAEVYRQQLDDAPGPSRWLTAQGVPTAGRWTVGYAPDRPAAVVNELRRRGFSDAEIVASGLAATSRGGQLVDRFRNRVMVGVRDHRAAGTPVVGWVGYAPPGAATDAAPVLHSPTTAVYRPVDCLIGLAEQPERDGRAVVARSALEAIALAERADELGEDAPLVVAPAGPTLTGSQVAALTAHADTAAGVTVVLDNEHDRHAERAYHLLAPAVARHPNRPGPLGYAYPGASAVVESHPLVEAAVTSRVARAARGFVTPKGRAVAADSIRAMLDGQPADLVDRWASYAAERLGVPVLPTPPAPATTTPDTAVDAPAPVMLSGAAATTGPPVESLDHPLPAPAADPAPDPPVAQHEAVVDAEQPVQQAPEQPVQQAPEQLHLDFPVADVEAPSREAGNDTDPAPTRIDAESDPDPQDEPDAGSSLPDDDALVLPDPSPDEPEEVPEPLAGAIPVEGVDGYHYTRGDDTVTTVYGPDNTVVAVGKSAGGGITAGEVGGVRITGAAIYGTRSFAELAARQHQAANLPQDQRDRVWIEFVRDPTAKSGHVIVVHGTVKDDPLDDRATKDAARFLWSGKKNARVSGRKWTARTVDDSLARLLSEFARQGRAVLVRPPDAGQPESEAPSPAPATTERQPQDRAALDPHSLSDEDLAEAIRKAEAQVGYGIRRDDAAAARVDALQKVRQDRVLRRVENAPEAAGMTDDELAAEQRWLIESFARTAFTSGDGARAVRARRDAVQGERQRREATVLLAGPTAQSLDDEALNTVYTQTRGLWVRMQSSHELHDVLEQRGEELRTELALRRIRHYEQRPDVAGMTLEDLAAESAELSGFREPEALFQRKDVNQARQARLAVVDTEMDRREAARYPDALARAQLRGSRATREVTIDGMPHAYGLVEPVPGKEAHFKAQVRYTTWLGEFPSRAAAVAALVRHYDTNPATYPQRTWGVPRDVALPVAVRTELLAWLEPRADSSPEWRRLMEILWLVPTRQADRNPLTGETMQTYHYSVEQGLLSELARVGERVTADLRTRSANTELPRKDREAAKRRIPAMGAALHNVLGLRDRLSAEGINTDLRAVDQSQVAAQLAALAGVDNDIEEGGDDSQPVQRDGAGALEQVPAPGAGGVAGPGSVLRPHGQPDPASGDRRAGGAGGGAGAGDGLPGAGGSAEPDPGHRGAAGDGAVAAAAGGRPGPADAAERAPQRPGRDQPGPEQDVAPFRPDPQDVPRGPLARAAANLEAIKVLNRLEQTRTSATRDDKRVLARWSGWGSVPVVFLEQPDEKNPVYGQGGQREGRYAQDLRRWEEYSPVRNELRELLDPFAWAAASRAVLSAHYTPQALAQAMWDGLRAFGFDGGEVLEAGCGSGTFFGTAPAGTVRLTGVELDPVTARIAQFIYPDANVLVESFADTDAPAGAFDVAIGNVPFAQVPFTERRYGATGHSLHNGFLIKELALVRPGGMVMAVTSRWTLDAEDTAARHQMARYGDLVAAYRLPAGVFTDTGTSVVVDVLVLRRRAEGQDPADLAWLDAPSRELNGSTHTINAYFTAHPEHVLGELTAASGPYGPAVTVKGDPARAVDDLRAALQQAAEQATADGRGYEPHPDGPDRKPLHLQTARDKHANDYTGRLYLDEDGRIWQHINGADPVEAVPSDGNTGQLLALMQLRDVAAELKELDRTGDEADRAQQLRARLRELHAAYTTAHGPLSRPRQTRLSAGAEVRERARAEGREVREDERTLTAWGWFREDPDAATVLALESWDRKHDVPVLSEVLTRRPGTRSGRLEHTDDPKTALTAVMGATGQVDLVRIAELLGTTPDEARRRLGTEVFDNPVTGRLEHAGIYLSGAVRLKLDEARTAAASDPAYAVNVAALETVQPREKRIGQFTPQLGAHWIPAPLVQGFLRQYLGDPTLRVDHNERYGWSLYAGKVPDAINALKGTERRSAVHIARAILGRGSLVVENAVSVGDKVVHEVDEDASRAARQKADAMRSAFEEYLTADSARVKALTDAYNRIMNGHVVRNYDGLAPTLAGFTDQRTPHPHQLSGAARMQFERGVILAHEVGLGKTTTMIMGTQALKASGQIHKPFAVVQRHLAKQWLDEAQFLYPNADIRLITSDLLSGDERRRTLEWLRSNTPDLTIFTEGAFTSVKMSPEFQEWYEFQEVDNLREQILRERGVPENGLAVMKLEQRLATLEARLRRNAAPMRTPGELYWEDLGFDYATIDELHRFKGVGFRSKEAGGDTAKIRAVDLHQKLTHMHQRADQEGGRPTVTGGTGTPLTNSIAEQYTMLALISPWVLRAYGVAGPDLWADTFGQKVQRVEMAPDGSGLKVVERFSRFISKSAMKTMWGLTTDTKTADDVGIKRPTVSAGGPQLRLIEPNPDQQARLKKLVARGAAIHAGAVSRDEDNMLAVANAGRAIACDARLLDPAAPPGGKLAAVADWFADRYHANKDRIYAVSTSDPTPHPVPGALLIGFLNQGTPRGHNQGNFNAYGELRDLCVARDVPADKIAFVQDHNHNPEQLAELFRKCREGEVAIILASTDTMGTGANIQNRALALAHIDLDWTPAGIEQRNGRIVRYGNQNTEVEIGIFALRGSMDSWQAGLLASKAEGLRDIQRPEVGDDTGDSVQEIGDTDWDYATMQAEIGGNPYMGQLMKARMHLAGLEADRRNQAADRLRQTELLAEKRAEATATRAAIERREQVMPSITPVRGDDFTIKIGDTTYGQRKDAGPVLRRAVTATLMQHQTPGTGAWRTLGRFGGIPIAARPEMTDDGQLQVQVGFPDLRHSDATYTVNDLTGDKIGGTMLLRLATALEKAPDHQSLDRQRLPELETEITLLTQQQEAADFTDRIEHARQRANLLDDVVATIAERDTVPELNDGDLDPEKYPTAEVRQQVIARRVTERQPLQAKVDQAIQNLNDFDRDHPAPDSAPPDDSSTAEPSSDIAEATPQPPAPAGHAADGTRPDWMTPARHAQLVKAITDYAPRYTAANTNGVLNSPARYVAEVHAPGGATREEWNWIADYIRQHPQVREGKPLTDDELAARDRAASTALSQRAMQALQAGDHATTFAIIDQAEPLYGHIEPWDKYRTAVQEDIARQQTGTPADPQPTPAPRSAAAENAAIVAQAFRPVSPSPALPPSAATTAAPATVRGAHPTRPEHDNAR
ncbi:helicase-related protein [Micromonospora echinofusca]|uniref:helicase-related protein n=1 Tax=Micromonospora echinofusca TaxID=47858 RepID=UPI0033266E18